MTRSEIESLVKRVLAEVTGMDSQNIQLSSQLVSDLGMESIDMVDFTYEAEKELQVKVDLFEAFQSVQVRSDHEFLDPSVEDIVQFIEKKIGENEQK